MSQLPQDGPRSSDGNRIRAALITGGGSGLGLECARALVQGGSAVTLMGRDEARLRGAVESLGSGATMSVGDVSDESAVQAAVATTVDSFGSLDMAVLAAGTGFVSPISAVDVEKWRSTFETNVAGAMLCIKHAARVMTRAGKGGSIVAISSLAARRVHRWWSPYCASKAALDMLVRCAADELGAAGIRVNAVRPGLIPTEISAELVRNPRVVDDYLDQMPIRRLGVPQDVASAVLFLLGHSSDWITGECLDVDGGHHLRRGPVLEAELEAQFGSARYGAEPATRQRQT